MNTFFKKVFHSVFFKVLVSHSSGFLLYFISFLFCFMMLSLGFLSVCYWDFFFCLFVCILLFLWCFFILVFVDFCGIVTVIVSFVICYVFCLGLFLLFKTHRSSSVLPLLFLLLFLLFLLETLFIELNMLTFFTQHWSQFLELWSLNIVVLIIFCADDTVEYPTSSSQPHPDFSELQ